jgi:NADPH:quinone reductase
MRAVIAERHGGPEVLRLAERDAPVPGPGQLLVDVAAAGVNFADIYQRKGLPPYTSEVPYVPGMEGAGIVAAVGPPTAGAPAAGAPADGPVTAGPGDRVAFTGVSGTCAEQVIIPADRAVPVPDGVDLELAAAVILQGMTAHYLSHDTYPVAAGDAVVVHAAAGGVGLLLTQMVKMRGGVVIATTSTPEKADLAREAGADHIAGYENFGAVARDVTGGEGVAAVYDGVGRATFDDSLAALRRRGYMVLYGAASGPVPPFELQRLAAGGSLFITRPTLGSYITTREELLHRAGDLFGWIRQGTLTVRIGGRYPLEQAARAHEDLAARRTTGKLILLCGGG